MKKIAKQVIRVGDHFIENGKAYVVVAITAAGSIVAQAQTDATAITTAAGSAFTGIAALCVTIGTFFVVYRLVKRVK